MFYLTGRERNVMLKCLGDLIKECKPVDPSPHNDAHCMYTVQKLQGSMFLFLTTGPLGH